jgi:phosphopantothenate-cysteine ligase
METGGKLSSDIDNLVLLMQRTPKIIGMIKQLQPSTIMVGFKLLNDVPEKALIEAGHHVMARNRCDFVLANDTRDMKNGGHIGYLISPEQDYVRLDGKQAIAKGIVSVVLSKLESGQI